jgi:cellulose biosynthesis protein BcsQ
MGLVRTRYDGRTTHSEVVSAKAAEMFSPYFPIFDTIIRERTAIRDAAASRQLVTEYQPRGDAASEYKELAEELWQKANLTH